MAPVVNLQVVTDIRRPTLKLRALQDRVGGAGLAAFMHGFAAPLLQDRAATRFAEEGDSASGWWQPLRESTIARREKENLVPIKINDRTGALRTWVENAPGRIVATKASAAIEWPGRPANSTTAKKLKVAQMGLSDPYTPRRPVVAIDSGDLLTIMAALEAWIGSVK